MIDPLTAFRRARLEFERRLDGLTPAQHDRPTPCADWAVGTLVRHVIDGDTFATLILGGATLDAAITTLMGMDDSREFAREADELDAAFAAADPALIVDHPVGPTTAADFLAFRTADYAGHAWDLARATGQDETLDPELVAVLWAQSEDRLADFSTSPHFGGGPTLVGDPVADDLQRRWLDRLGRDASH